MKSANISYQVTLAHPGAHIFGVECRVENPDPHGQCVWMPVWIPGSYMVRDFAKNITGLRARNETGDVDIVAIDKTHWRCAPCDGPLVLEYRVYAWDLSVRTAHLDTTHGYFNGSSLFLAVTGFESEPVSVELIAPDGERYRNWQVATSLPSDGAERWGYGRYRADSYDDLIDHPVEMGEFSVASFSADGVAHDIVVSGRHNADMDRLCRDLKQICEHHIQFFATPSPVERYLFLVWVVGDGYGGLEHRASTSLLCSRDDLPRQAESEVSEKYRGFLGLCSHEYFHTWNVKRIRPLALAEADLSSEAYTRQLWIFEGITSYFDDLSLLRCGLIDTESYLELLARVFTRVLRGEGRHKQSLADSSFDAWTKFYHQDENAPNAIVSYYTKGSLVALALDLTLRKVSEGKTSLDDVMRRLWAEYGQIDKPLADGEVEAICSDIAGVDLSGFFEMAIRGYEDPDWSGLLAGFGIDMRLRSAQSDTDLGGRAKPQSDDGRVIPWLGARLINAAGQCKVANVFDSGPAQHAGISAGDIVLAMDGIKVIPASVDARIRTLEVGQHVDMHVFRRDELMQFSVTLNAAPQTTCALVVRDDVTDDVIAHRDDWLRSI
ncbi:MAG TPA: M61 family peptidase [Chromatiales bacterium]|nr:M61 family peptidase [Chromatiales bacterium]